MDYAEVAHQLRRAATRQELIRASQQIQHVESLCDRERLAGLVKNRLTDFKQK